MLRQLLRLTTALSSNSFDINRLGVVHCGQPLIFFAVKQSSEVKMVREIKEFKEVKEFSNLPKFSKLSNLSPLTTLHNPYIAPQTHVPHAHRPYQRI